MSYTVTLRNKVIYPLEDIDAELLKQGLSSANGPSVIELGDDMVRASEIVRIEKNKPVSASLDWAPGIRQIEASKCSGKYSIQKEINSIAKEHGDWTTRIMDNKWRATTRQQLLDSTEDWCDYKTGRCACDS